MYKHIQVMIFPEDRKRMSRDFIVESPNTGATWRLTKEELDNFFTGRKKPYYRIFKRLQ